jgi:hypothetical protein
MEWRLSRSSPCFNLGNPFKAQKYTQLVIQDGVVEKINTDEGIDIMQYENIALLLSNAIKVLTHGSIGEARGLLALLSPLDCIDVSDNALLLSYNPYICMHNMDHNEVSPVRLCEPDMIFAFHNDYNYLYHTINQRYIHVHSHGCCGDKLLDSQLITRGTYHKSSFCMGGYNAPTREAFREHDFMSFLMNINESLHSYNPVDAFADHATEMTNFVHPEDEHYLYECDCGKTVWNGLVHDCAEEHDYCCNCDREIPEDDTHWFNADTYCDECYDNIAFYCECCDNDRSKENRVDIWTDYHTVWQTVCDRCRDDFYYCETCDKYYQEEYISSYDDQYICDHCAEEHAFYCNRCGNYHMTDNRGTAYAYRDGAYQEEAVCKECIENEFTVCSECGRLCNEVIEDKCMECIERGTGDEQI